MGLGEIAQGETEEERRGGSLEFPWEQAYVRQCCMGSRGLGRAALLRASVQTQGPVTRNSHSEWVKYMRILRDARDRQPGKRPDFLVFVD